MSWHGIIIIGAVLCMFASLPAAIKCDTSYYETYFSARRFIPLKRNSMVEFNFTVKLDNEDLVNFERVALTGDIKELGEWYPEKAILLNRTGVHNIWTGSVQVPPNTIITYRYFIAGVHNEPYTVQVRKWESNIYGRKLNTTSQSSNNSDDIFGIMNGGANEVQKGWLNTGHIVQFKLYRNPMRINENYTENVNVRIKLQPIDSKYLVPILPSTHADTQYVRMIYGDSVLREQPEYGVPFEEDDIIVFHTTVANMNNVVYLLKIYSSNDYDSLVRLIGYQYIYADVLDGSEGIFTVNLISPIWLHSIGSIDVEYLIINPKPNSTFNLRTSFVEHWRDHWTAFDVGHRGLGRTLKQASNAAPVIENTLASLIASGELGADMVEFDVQLTSDLIPVIYHDFVIFVCIESKKPKSKDDLTEVLIKDVTYEQLKDLKTYQVINNKVYEYPAHNSVEQEEQRLFPMFEDFLKKVNKSIGFDIEIKWPQLLRNGILESIQTIDKNTYIDRILDVIEEHGCGRFMFFTSFDADICSLVRFKQNMYPVMFLSATGEQNFADPRSDTLYHSVNNAQAFDLAGVVPNAIWIQRNPSLLQVAINQNKKIFLWGDVIKDTESIAWFKAQGSTGVIYDRLDLWLSPNKTNIFEMEADRSDLFNLQCIPQDGGEISTNNISFL